MAASRVLFACLIALHLLRKSASSEMTSSFGQLREVIDPAIADGFVDQVAQPGIAAGEPAAGVTPLVLLLNLSGVN